jgi:Mg-chelatase subunit ChlD
MDDTSLNFLSDLERQSLLRWRLVLGRRAEQCQGSMLSQGGGSGGKGGGDSFLGIGGLAGAGGIGEAEVDVFGLDNSLELVYSERSAGLSNSSPNIPRWLGDIRRYFPADVVQMVQKDAIERQGLKELLLDKDTLPLLEKNVELVGTILQLQRMMSDEVRQTARIVVGEIVENIKRKLEQQIRQSVSGALNRKQHSPIPIYRNLDWRRTLRRSLKNYDPERKRLISERFYFWSNQKKFADWQIVVCVDQSGSMASSVVYSSIMAAIFASLEVLQTHLVFFDTSVVDMTPMLFDPIEILFASQLGGGTDIAQAVSYCRGLITQPEKTIFILITDLYEGGNQQILLQELNEMVESKIKATCLLALDDTARPGFDHEMARKVRALGIPTFACTPKKLVEFIEDILGQRR